jgi:hypothetical protein
MACALESIYKTKEVFMKRIFTLVSFLAITFSVMADRKLSKLSITSMYYSPIHVMVDGRWVQDYNNEIRITDLYPGLHRVQIYSIETRWNVFGNKRTREQMIYNGAVNVRRGFHTTMVVQRNGRVYSEERPMNNGRGRDKWNKDGRWDNDDHNDRWENDDRDDRWNNEGRRDNDDQYDNRNNGKGWEQPMNYNLFEQLKQQVRRESFDNRRLDILRSALAQNNVSSEQVKDLARELDFERNKLELAKFAYKYTTDRRNYFVVNDVFDFGTSKTELTQYIANYRD